MVQHGKGTPLAEVVCSEFGGITRDPSSAGFWAMSNSGQRAQCTLTWDLWQSLSFLPSPTHQADLLEGGDPSGSRDKGPGRGTPTSCVSCTAR